MKRQSVKKGIFIMSLANLINKGIGGAYNIALVYLLTSKGVGLLNNAMNIYTTLVVGFTTGFSTAMAKIISENMSLGRHRYAHRVFKISFYLFIVIGIISGILMYFISMYLVIDSDVYYSVYILIPALFFVAVSTVFRGYFQGMRYMTPIAIAQLGDQLSKIAVGTLLVLLFMPNIRLAAFGAACGFACGAFISLCIMILSYLSMRRNIHFYIDMEHDKDSPEELAKDIIRNTLSYAIPISLGGTIIQAIGIVDQFFINKVLPSIGYNVEHVKLLYGIYTGQAMKLIDIPSIFTVAVSVNMLPAIASAYASGSFLEIKSKTIKAYKLVTLISIPAAFGLSILAHPIIKLIFRKEAGEAGGLILEILALSIIFISLIQVSTSVLQGMNKIYIPIKNITAGFIVKLTLSLLLFIYPDYVITIIPASTVCCYMTCAILNIYDVRKQTGIIRSDLKHIYITVFNALLMAISVGLLYNIIIRRLHSNTTTVFMCVIIGILFYSVLSYFTGVIKGQDLEPIIKKMKR